LKQLQEVVINTLEHTGRRNNFLKRTSMAYHLRERMNKWDCINLKGFCTAKEDSLDLKYYHRMEENLPAIHLIRD
jgi:hypothetical protein